MHRLLRHLLFALVLVLLTSCGGGGGSSSGPAVPLAPLGVVAVAGDGQAALSWSASANATAYSIKRATTSGGPYTAVGSASSAAYTDSGLNDGATYFYVIAALNGMNEGPNSSEISATPQAPTLSVLPADDPSKNYIGLGTWFLNDWDGSFAFVDAMKQARPWQDGANWSQPVAGIDALGWPTADASTVVMTGTPAEVNGTYKLVFNGQATVSLLWATGSVSNVVYTAATNTTTADVTYNVNGSNSYGLVFLNTKRTATSAVNTGFTNVHLYRPGYASDGSQIFTTPFLNALGFASAVRMMDWTYTNQNLVQHWADRITPLHMSKTGLPYTGPGGGVWSSSQSGVAIEYQIELCNTLHHDCWINIPVVADDAFVRNLALALRFGTDGTHPYGSTQAHPVYPPLDPGLHLYLEYGNEIWNSAGGFDCFGVIQDIVSSLPASHPVLNPAQNNIWFNMWRYPAWRMAGISSIFRSVYGDASMMNRVRPLLMTQQGDGQSTISQAMTWLDGYAHSQTPARSINYYLYGAGGSGYYSVNTEPTDHTDVNAFFATGNYPATATVAGVGLDAVWATNFGLKRIAYEGGPSLDNFADADAQAINADARMQDMVVQTHNAWSNQGGDLLMYYTVRGPADWEFTRDITVTNTPKLNALSQLQGQPRAPVTLGQALPGTIIATDEVAYRIRTGYDYASTCDSLPCLGGNNAGTWTALPGNSSAAFNGTIVVNGIAPTATTMNVWVNGVNEGQITMAAGSHLTNSSSLSTAIPAGLVVIRLDVVSGGLNLRSISVH